MVEVWLDMFLRHGVFHADPHPGNIVLLEDGRLGLIDFGTVGRLTNDDIRRLTRLFLDAAAGDVDELPRHLAALGVRFPVSVEETLRADLAELFGRYHGRPMTEIDVPLLIRETFGIIHKNGLRLPSRFVLLDKTIATVISVCQGVYPAFNLIEVVRPFARDMTVGPWAWRQRAKEVASWSQAILDLPGEVEGSLARLAAGQIEVGFRHENLDVPLRRLDVMNNRLVLGVVISAFFVASSLVAVLPEDGPQLFGLHAFGLAGLLLAVPLAALLGLAILRSGRI
jgi:ubiquinone biosynthesis protein